MSSLRCIYCDSLCFGTGVNTSHICGNHKISPHFYVNYTYSISYIYFYINYNHDYTVCIIPNKLINVYIRSECILKVPYFPFTPENVESVLLKLLKLKNFS
jgi:hypothetical protein